MTNLRNTLAILVLLLTVSSITQVSSLNIGNTFFWWIVQLIILIILYKSKNKYLNIIDNKNIYVINVYLIWNIICVIRGFFIAENYWEWKNLISASMVLLLPMSINFSTNIIFVQKVLNTWFKYAIPFFAIFFVFINGDAVGRFLVPVSFLMLFFPILNYKWKVAIASFSILAMVIDFEARSNIVKFGMPIVLNVLYVLYFFRFNIGFVVKFVRLVLLATPFILISLGISGLFNIFRMEDYLKGNYVANVVVNGETKEAVLTADTRTQIYQEVLQSAIKYDYYIIGRTPARGNESEAYGLHLSEGLKTGKSERFANEVSILNIFTWTGLVGVIIYFFIFYRASYLAIYKSNNIYVTILGLYISFRWLYAWVEDFTNFDLSYFFLWIMIGLCFSTSFRTMSDLEMKSWINDIFHNRRKAKPITHGTVNLNKISN